MSVPHLPDLLITGGTVLTLDETGRVIPDGSVLVKNGRIAAVGAGDGFGKGFDGTVVDAEGGLILPGLVNAHTHLPMSLFRGLADDLPLMTWLNEHIFPAEARYIDPETVRLGTLLSCAELLLSGTTCCCDGYFFEDHVAGAVAESGLRAVLGQGVIDFPAPGVPNPADNVAHAVAFVDRWADRHPLIRPSIFCHSPYTCSARTLTSAKAAARERDILFQIHVAETRKEREQMLHTTGKSPVGYLDHLGVLDEKTLVVHGIHVDEDDLAILARRNTALAHAPESNMKLASGVAPLPSYLARGIVCGLGTDGSASNNNQDLFAEMDSAAKLHKVMAGDPTVISAAVVLDMATKQGARALGLAGRIGSLEPGRDADLIVVCTRAPHLTPMYRPDSHLVYSATGADVRHVIIGGRMVVENRRLLTLDLSTLLAEARTFGQRIMADRGSRPQPALRTVR
ncbi:amidohydrolase [Desulfatiferula olefinivorans]